VYGSVAGKYWRDKLHVIRNGLTSDKDEPSLSEGIEPIDR
jgi:hypothetical protein